MSVDTIVDWLYAERDELREENDRLRAALSAIDHHRCNPKWIGLICRLALMEDD